MVFQDDEKWRSGFGECQQNVHHEGGGFGPRTHQNVSPSSKTADAHCTKTHHLLEPAHRSSESSFVAKSSTCTRIFYQYENIELTN